MKQKQFSDSAVIKTEQMLHDFYKSLGLSGFFNRTQFDFLAVIRCYLMTLNVPVTPESITRIAADCLKGVLDRICSIEECKVLLQSTAIWGRYQINDWGALNGMLYELQFKLAELYPEYRKEPAVLKNVSQTDWMKKMAFLQGKPSAVLHCTFTQLSMSGVVSDNKNRCRLRPRNLMIVGPEKDFLPLREEISGHCCTDVQLLSLKDDCCVKLNPFDYYGGQQYDLDGLAETIATVLTGGKTQDVFTDTFAHHIVGACMVWLKGQDRLTLPQLLSMLKEPFVVLLDKIREYPESSKYIPQTVNAESARHVLDILCAGAEKSFTPALCRVTQSSDNEYKRLFQNKCNIIYLPLDDGLDTCLFNNLMVEIFLQKMNNEHWLQPHGFHQILYPDNLLVITDISQVRLNRMEKYNGIRNYNPFQLIVGYRHEDDFLKFQTHKELGSWYGLSHDFFGYWQVVDDKGISE